MVFKTGGASGFDRKVVMYVASSAAVSEYRQTTGQGVKRHAQIKSCKSQDPQIHNQDTENLISQGMVISRRYVRTNRIGEEDATSDKANKNALPENREGHFIFQATAAA